MTALSVTLKGILEAAHAPTQSVISETFSNLATFGIGNVVCRVFWDLPDIFKFLLCVWDFAWRFKTLCLEWSTAVLHARQNNFGPSERNISFPFCKARCFGVKRDVCSFFRFLSALFWTDSVVWFATVLCDKPLASSSLWSLASEASLADIVQTVYMKIRRFEY